MRLEHHLVGGYVRYISPHIIIIIITSEARGTLSQTLKAACFPSLVYRDQFLTSVFLSFVLRIKSPIVDPFRAAALDL